MKGSGAGIMPVEKENSGILLETFMKDNGEMTELTVKAGT